MINGKFKNVLFSSHEYFHSFKKALRCIFKVFSPLPSSTKWLMPARYTNALRNELFKGTLGSSNESSYKATNLLLWKESLCNLASIKWDFPLVSFTNWFALHILQSPWF